MSASAPIPARAGIGLRHPHVAELLETRPSVAWLEVHSENYLGDGGAARAALERLRRDYPLSAHGVGLSLGSAQGLARDHLAKLRALYDRLEPGLVSEHLAWCVIDGAYYPDLLPLPYTREALEVVCRNLDRAQSALGRRLLLENPSTYLAFAEAEYDEPGFLAETVRRSGCGLLLDVNNIHVSARNHGFDPRAYLAAVPWAAVGEIHVAGHAVRGDLLIDDHGAPVAGAVWTLLAAALAHRGPVPVLLERDTAIPPLPELLAEAARAQALLDEVRGDAAARLPA